MAVFVVAEEDGEPRGGMSWLCSGPARSVAVAPEGQPPRQEGKYALGRDDLGCKDTFGNRYFENPEEFLEAAHREMEDRLKLEIIAGIEMVNQGLGVCIGAAINGLTPVFQGWDNGIQYSHGTDPIAAASIIRDAQDEFPPLMPSKCRAEELAKPSGYVVTSVINAAGYGGDADYINPDPRKFNYLQGGLLMFRSLTSRWRVVFTSIKVKYGEGATFKRGVQRAFPVDAMTLGNYVLYPVERGEDDMAEGDVIVTNIFERLATIGDVNGKEWEDKLAADAMNHIVDVGRIIRSLDLTPQPFPPGVSPKSDMLVRNFVVENERRKEGVLRAAAASKATGGEAVRIIKEAVDYDDDPVDE